MTMMMRTTTWKMMMMMMKKRRMRKNSPRLVLKRRLNKLNRLRNREWKRRSQFSSSQLSSRLLSLRRGRKLRKMPNLQ